MPNPPVYPPTRRALLRWSAALLLGAACWGVAQADGADLGQFSTQRGDDGLELSFVANFELPHSVEDALHKSVPIYFTADVALLRHRWYWRDARVANVSRTWRLAYQPLTRQYKVSTGGLNQSFASLPEAMALVRGQSGWHIADAKELEDGGGYYIEFSYRLDTSQLPRPMQIGLGATQGWGLSIEHTVALNPDFSVHSATP
ncbi:MAG: DUF4390 domain-containing protein [Pelomonas sp.]|nr:DUF4390 domain-containing protein [Roseateles sp.]